MIDLSFICKYASINQFPNITLPSFTLITGENGVGKTHLLQSISRGDVQACTKNGYKLDKIIYYDWLSLKPNILSNNSIFGNTSYIYISMAANVKKSNWVAFTSIISQFNFDHIFDYFKRNGFHCNSIDSIGEILKYQLIDSSEKTSEIRTYIEKSLNDLSKNIFEQMSEELKLYVENVLRFRKIDIVFLSEQDFTDPSIPIWGNKNLFEQSFFHIFNTYRHLILQNQLAENAHIRIGEGSFLSDKEFEEIYGPPPWSIVNQCFNELGLDFEINHPNTISIENYEPIIKKKSSGEIVDIDNLSSGEKVLMSFSFCLIDSIDSRINVNKPNLLLIDEFDCPLHPSMTRRVFRVINDVLVQKFGLNIIATTHSPTTIAIAPEESIFVMKPNIPGLHKTSKGEALNLLTADVPTLSISYDGRRQVFVESPTDAEIYGKLYEIMKPRLSSGRSLEFIATGTRVKGTGDRNGGCSNVYRLVDGLTESGNLSVFGLVDWDNNNRPNNRVFVIADGERDGLENILLDPLLIGFLIYRDFRKHLPSVGLIDSLSYIDAIDSDKISLQNISDIITDKIFKDKSDRLSSKYWGGLEIFIDDQFFKTDDHELNSIVLEKIPFLNSIDRDGSGSLMKHIVDTVIRDKPDLIPKPIVDIIQTLIERDVHPS